MEYWLNNKLTDVSMKEAVLKLIDAKGFIERYGNPHDKWTDAINIGIEAIERQQEISKRQDEICENICRWRILAFETHKDVDEAEKWLDDNYCSKGCPVSRLS